MSTWDLYTPDSPLRIQRDASPRLSSREDAWRVLLAESSEVVASRPEPFMTMRGIMSDRRMRGFSLMETMMVVGIILIMSAITFISLQPALQDARVNSAYDTTLSQLRMARQRSIEERKQYIVCIGNAAPLGAATPLGAPNAQSIQLFRWDAGTAIAAAVQISTVQLPQNVNFQTVSGFPSTGPDQFGSGSVAIDLDQGVAGGNKQQVMFLPDGSARDTLGNLNNGVIYIARPGSLYSGKAITLFGSTGRIRGWRLVSGATAKWVQL
jgi:prepilin-type N-terminal cleavage/methylation domain-containing protein